jgi:TolB protein
LLTEEEEIPMEMKIMKASLLVLAVVLAAMVAGAAAILAGSPKPAEAAFPGKNGDIIFTNRESCALADISRIHPDGTGLRDLTCNPTLHAYSQYPAWSADGKKIVFQNDADDADEFGRDLWVMDANGRNRVNITNTPNVDEWQPAWFPSGKKIAYQAAGIEVLTLNARGKATKTTRLTSDGAEPAISPNGKKIAFASHRDGDAEIYVMRSDIPEGPNNRPGKLTDNATYSDSQPDWSPDGSRIVYSSARGGNWEDIFVMRADGSGKKNLTRNPARDQHPVFSPDGRWVAFDSDRNLWKMRIDGTRLTQLTSDDENLQPDWQPRP